jgi:hypothetical protein
MSRKRARRREALGVARNRPASLADDAGHPAAKENCKMSKFGNLTKTEVAKPYRVELIDPVTNEVIVDKAGRKAFIDVYSTDSEKARGYDKAKRKDLMLRIRQSRTGVVEPDDALEENIAKCSVLTAAWHLVDPVTREPLKVDCSPEDAADLYSPPGMAWLFLQPWVAANHAANFLPPRPRPSVLTPPGAGATSAS